MAATCSSRWGRSRKDENVGSHAFSSCASGVSVDDRRGPPLFGRNPPSTTDTEGRAANDDIHTAKASSSTGAPRARLRWRRQGTSEQLTSDALPRQENVLECENAVSCVLQGLCPKSKMSLMNSARLLLEPELATDFASVLTGGAHHLKSIFCRADEHILFQRLRIEIETSGLWRSRWDKSGKEDSYEWTIAPENGQRSTGRITGPDAETLSRLPAHNYVLETLASLFNVKPLSWWINLYPGGTDSKDFHKDNFGQNITIGASFGATRSLTFRHGVSRDEFHFPQENGDVFAFRESVNNAFLHGMYKLPRSTPDPGPRISVIMMGRAPES